MIDKCTTCCGDVVEKDIEEVLRGGGNTAIVPIRAGVCLRCGERFYDLPTARKLDEVELKLSRDETDSFKPIGQSFEVM